MPAGIKLISTINVTLLVLYPLLWAVLGAELRINHPLAIYVAWLTFAGLFAVQAIVWWRARRLLGFGRVLLYGLAILQGLQVMLTIKAVFSYAGAGLVTSALLAVFYLIGLRGYLASPAAAVYFSGNHAPHS
ncbi:MAG: hypothetical protein HY080_04200 [Gammaproteobacteria bacterium]|nr:hypothetical protein [Gammaproteobacteria bacterium]